MYSYVKGKGWIPVDHPVINLQGKDYYLIEKIPEIGEYFDYWYMDNSDGYVKNGKLNMDRVIESFKDYSDISNFCKVIDPDYWRLADPDHVFVVISPVS